MIQSVTVYCSSSSSLDPIFYDAAGSLGRAIAGRGWSLVYGGNFVGLMKAVATGAKGAGGKVVGITPRLMHDKGLSDKAADELIVTNNMRDRKALLEERGDGFVILPGGIGTLEEMFEIVVGRQLGYHTKPVVLLNVAGYYQPLLDMMDHGIRQKFMRPDTRSLYFVAETVDAAVEYLDRYVAGPVADNWWAPPSPAVE